MAVACLTEEAIDELVEMGLDGQRATDVEQHLLACERCRRLVSAVVQLRERGETGSEDDEKIGRYRILREVGAGAMGVVYAAHDDELDRPVAVKLLRPLAASDDLVAHEERLRREAQAMARLQHQAVVRVFEIGRADDQLYVAMELIDGESLAAWLRVPREERAIVRAFIEAGRGLVAAHEQGLIHRDFKPDNVLIGRDGRVCVADFGMVRAEPDARTTPTGPLTLTQTGAFMGTPAYMASEILRGESATEQSDQYAFAVSLYEAVYGCRPFVAANVAALADQIQRGDKMPPLPGRTASRWLARAIDRGLSSDPSRRFASMKDFVAELERGLAPRARPRWRTIVPLALLFAGLAVVVLLRRPSPACVRADARIRGLLDAKKRDAVRVAFARAAPAYGESTYAHVMTELERQRDSLASALSACCGARVGRADLSTALQLECILERVDEAEALVELFAGADRDRTAEAARAVESLRPVSLCVREQAGAREADREALARTRSCIARVASDANVGAFPAALAGAQACNQAAIASGSRAAQAEASYELGHVRSLNNDWDGAREALRAAASHAEATRLDEVAALSWIELMVRDASSREDSERDHDRARAAVDRIGAPPDLEASLLTAVGLAAKLQSRNDDAVAAYRQALAIVERLPTRTDLDVASLDSKLAYALGEAGHPEEALTVATRALEINERVLGPLHPHVADALQARGNAYARLGRFEESEADEQRALLIDRAVYGPKHSEVENALCNLGNRMARNGHAEAGLALVEEAIVIRSKLGEDSLDMAYDLAIFGFVNERAGHYAEAERADVRAIALFKKWRGPDEEWIAITCANLGRVMLDVNRPKDALRQYEASLAVYRAGKQSGADLAHPYTGMGEAWLALKQAARAAPPLEQALALRESGKVPPRDLARTRYQLARALEGTHEHARACELADAASAAYEANPLATSAGLRETSDARDWLSAHCAH